MSTARIPDGMPLGLSRYYDRDGRPIDMWTWASKFEDHGYRQVASTEGQDWRVSTIWLGLDHAMFGGPPLIFETMVFGLGDEHMQRYSTELAARAGHDQAVMWARDQAAGC